MSKRRSGNDPRGSKRRTRLFTVRLSGKEADIVAQIVERTGLSAAALVRRALLDAQPSARRPSAEDRAVVRLMGTLGKIASNIHQLDGHADMGSFDDDTAESIHYAVRDLAELRYVCMQTLGYEEGDSAESEHDESDLDGPDLEE